MDKSTRNLITGLLICIVVLAALSMFLTWDAANKLESCTAQTKRAIQGWSDTLDLSDACLIKLQECRQ